MCSICPSVCPFVTSQCSVRTWNISSCKQCTIDQALCPAADHHSASTWLYRLVIGVDWQEQCGQHHYITAKCQVEGWTHWLFISSLGTQLGIVSDIVIFVLKRVVKLQLTNHSQASIHLQLCGSPRKSWSLKGRSLRPEGPKSEARMAEMGGFLSTGCSPPHQLRGLGECS